jgi:hypothetical protein
MKYTLSKFPNGENKETWQVLIPGSPMCKETDEVTASALARELLHKETGNELWFWNAYTEAHYLLDKS